MEYNIEDITDEKLKELSSLAEELKKSDFIYADIIAQIPKLTILIAKQMQKMEELKKFSQAIFSSQQFLLSLLTETDAEFRASALEAVQNILYRKHEYDNLYLEKVYSVLLRQIQSDQDEHPVHPARWSPIVIEGEKPPD